MADRNKNPKRGKKVYGIRLSSPDEEVVYHTRMSMMPTFMRGIPFFLIGVAVTIIIHMWKNDATTTALAAGVALLIVLLSRVPGILNVIRDTIVLSNRRLYMHHGIIDIDDHSASIASISDVHVDPDVLGRMLNYADVSIQTNSGELDFDMKAVKGAYRLSEEIFRLMDEATSGYGYQMQSGMTMGYGYQQRPQGNMSYPQQPQQYGSPQGQQHQGRRR